MGRFESGMFRDGTFCMCTLFIGYVDQNNYYCTADSESAGNNFFFVGTHVVGHLEGFFTPKLS